MCSNRHFQVTAKMSIKHYNYHIKNVALFMEKFALVWKNKNLIWFLTSRMKINASNHQTYKKLFIQIII